MVIAAIVGYLLGSIPTAKIVGHFKGVDPLTRGDGNPGWWNMHGLVGNRSASIVLVVDVAKGALAAAVGLLLWGPWWTGHVGLAFAMLGHAFPVFARFRGGRSVLTFVGGMLVLSPVAALLAMAVGAVVLLFDRRFLHGGRMGLFAFPFLQALFEPRAEVLVTLGLGAFIAFRFAFSGQPARFPAGVPLEARLQASGAALRSPRSRMMTPQR